MLQFIKENMLLTLVMLAAVLGLVYYAFFMQSPSNTGSTTLVTSTDVAGSGTPSSQDLLVTISNLHTIKLDGALFADPGFVSLTDFGVIIPLENVGRRNPFAPVVGAQPAPTTGAAAAIKLPATKKK